MRAFVVLLLLCCSLTSTASVVPPAKVSILTNACCETSQYLIEKALRGLDGVERCELDLVTKKVKIRYDEDKVDVATLRQAIAATGFTADEVPARPQAYDKLPNCCKHGGETACKKQG